MSRLSFALTIAVLVCAVVVLSVFALQKLLVSGPGNQGSAEQATQETTQATETTEETTAYAEETTAYLKEETTALRGGERTTPPESTEQASASSGFVRSGTGSRPFWLRFDGINYDTPYEEWPGRPLRNEDLGPKLAEVPYGVHDQSASPTAEEGYGTSDEVPVYAVEGYDTSFRLAARIEDRLIKFQAVYNPKANEAADVLDIGGKVRSISITDAYDPGLVFGTVGDSEEVERVVQDLMDAPLKRTGPDYYLYAGDTLGNRFLVVFRLEDGTAEGLEYRRDYGRLTNVFSVNGIEPASGIVTPKSFREAVDGALEGYLEYLAQQSPTKSEERRQKRTCDDTRTTSEARRINGGGVFYTTNDVYPGGPWGGVLMGTGKNDKLADGNGEDEVSALGGDDTVEGGACDDEVYGGPGNDTIYGGDGNEVVYGGSGKDALNGEEGDDVIYGGPGDDGLGGYSGQDVLYGGYGHDQVNGLDGQRDELYCGGDRDEYYADKIDYVDSSCEVKKQPPSVVGGPTDPL